MGTGHVSMFDVEVENNCNCNRNFVESFESIIQTYDKEAKEL
jgi:hypothetical protein